jgi:hypothetical protein
VAWVVGAVVVASVVGVVLATFGAEAGGATASVVVVTTFGAAFVVVATGGAATWACGATFCGAAGRGAAWGAGWSAGWAAVTATGAGAAVADGVVAVTSATGAAAGAAVSAAAVDWANRAPNVTASAVPPTALSDVAPTIRRRPASRVRAPWVAAAGECRWVLMASDGNQRGLPRPHS